MTGPKVTVGSQLVWASQAFAAELGMDDQLRELPAMKKAALNVNSAWLEAPLNDEWTTAFRLLIQNGMPVIAELRIFPAENFRQRHPGEWSASVRGTNAAAPSGGITMPLLRRVKLGIVRAKIAEALEQFRDRVPDVMKMLNLVADPKEKRNKNENRGRPANSDLEYALIADYYSKRCAHESRKPVAETAKRFKITTAKARSRLHEARKRGLLTFGQQGIAWGELTDKARLVLKEKSKRKGVK